MPYGDNIALSASELGLKYHLRSEDRQTLKWTFLNTFIKRTTTKEFWALQDVTFSIPKGETWGIMGKNGSGKSSLLKLITGILRPDSGKLTVNGSVSALLELGAGFQPDLTGRENIYLNGSLLGLSQREITVKFDEIVEFSGIGDFIETPVKHYSSGMYMRLGFSIAINVNPEILLIDEIFAVGDLQFQERCIDRINQIRSQNKSIILVSHDMNSIKALCNHAIWLDNGKIQKIGNVDEVIDFYKNNLIENDDARLELSRVDGSQQRWGTGTVRIDEVNLYNQLGKKTKAFSQGEQLTCVIKYYAKNKVKKPVFGIAIHRNDGIHLCGPNTKLNKVEFGDIKGKGEVHYIIPSIPFLPGTYLLSAVVYDQSIVIPYDHLDRMFPFTIIDNSSPEIYGLINMGGKWEIHPD